MILFKKIEAINKKFTYSIIKLFLRNKPINLPISADNIKRILIFRYDAIGDMIVTAPVFDLLKRMIPGCELHILASNRNSQLIRHDKRISKVFILPKGIMALYRLTRVMRKEKYDLVISCVFNRTTFAGILSNLIVRRDVCKATIEHDSRRDLYSTFFNAQIPLHDLRARKTMVEIQYELICRLFGWEDQKQEIKLNISVDGTNFQKAKDYFSSLPKEEIVAYNISSGNEFRKLKPSKNIEIIKALKEFYPHLNFLIISTPNDKSEAETIVEATGAYIYPDTNDILEIFAVISYADMVITPDTAMIHVAAVCGKPVLGMYSRLASYIEEWVPYGVPYRTVLTKERVGLDSLENSEIIEAFKSLYSDFIRSKR